MDVCPARVLMAIHFDRHFTYVPPRVIVVGIGMMFLGGITTTMLVDTTWRCRKPRG
jgi:hypothetical protein